MADKNLKIVNPKARVTLYGTEKSNHHNVGEAFEASALLAEKLIASGRATKEAPVAPEFKNPALK
jgi:hypothetical protein